MKPMLLLLCILFELLACDPAIDTKLKLINASNKPVLIMYNTEGKNHEIHGLSENYNPFHEIQQADSTRCYQARVMKDNPNYVLPGDTISAHLGVGKWENHIGNGKLWVYVFKPETVLNNNWDGIRLGQKWNKVYSLTLDQVKAKNWVISL
jgi:hypothetical protein